MGNCVKRRQNKISSIVTDAKNSSQKLPIQEDERKKMMMLKSKQAPILCLESDLYKRRAINQKADM